MKHPMKQYERTLDKPSKDFTYVGEIVFYSYSLKEVLNANSNILDKFCG